jgi:hypothetical protein
MSHGVDPGPSATPADLRTAQERDRLLSTELPRVRTAAIAWRNGLAGLLTALAGFGLIKGQSDISQLGEPWAIAAGVILLGAFVAGASGAVLLIRAASGRPAVVPTSQLTSRAAADHEEALAAASALRVGIMATLACSFLLVAAVGVTWYGPPPSGPALQVTTPGATVCGSVVSAGHGRLTLQTPAGQVTESLAFASAIQAVSSCPASGPPSG